MLETNKYFDPDRMRWAYIDKASDKLSYCLNKKYETNRPMGNGAVSDLNNSICAWLVGLETEIAPVIPRALEWLERAIQEDEEFGMNRNYHRRTLHWAKALGLWMYNNINDAGEWEKTRHFFDAAMAEGTGLDKKDEPKRYLNDYMAFCYQAEQYEMGISKFEMYHGEKEISLKRVLQPYVYGYALCLHKARQQFDPEALFEAGRKMLRSNLQSNWVGDGQYNYAATWLKIVYWHHDPSLTPVQTVLKAYENMPAVPRPEFL